MPIRHCLAALAASFLAIPLGAKAETDINMVLNWKYQGPQVWFLLAQDKGYFAEEGLNVSIDQGEGSAAAITKVASGAYDAGFGDINALIDLAAHRPEVAPVGVYMVYNVPPFTIATRRDGPIGGPEDLPGTTLGAPANDAALKLFPAFARSAGFDGDAVEILNMAPNLREPMLMRGQVDGVIGYYSTIYFSARRLGLDPEIDLHFINFNDHGLELYSNAIVFSREFVTEHPEAVRGFVKAVNRAIQDTIADPEIALDSLMKREPLLDREMERDVLMSAMQVEMSHPEIAEIGLGDYDDARMENALDIIARINDLPRRPEAEEIFDRSFLPPRDERPSTLKP